MKELWIDHENPKFCIGILDENNYCHAKLTKTKGWESYQWFSTLRGAVLRVCKTKANERCTDLSDWLLRFDEMLKQFEALLDHTEPQNTAEKARRRAGKGTCSEKMGNDLSPAFARSDPSKSGVRNEQHL